MSVVKSTVRFTGYRVTKALFETINVELCEINEIELQPVFTRCINKVGKDSYLLILGVKIGSQEPGEKLPFIAEVNLEGEFTIEGDYDAEKIMKINAVAILFPYLRATLSMLTNIANINPLVLPTINLVQMFENEHTQEASNS